MRTRREFITLLGGAAAWPISARAQQPTIPVIGFMSARSPAESASDLAAFRQGLGQAGYFEGKVSLGGRALRSITGDGRRISGAASCSDRCDRRHHFGTGGKSSDLTIPIVFNVGDDPIQSGLVASFKRPGECHSTRSASANQCRATSWKASLTLGSVLCAAHRGLTDLSSGRLLVARILDGRDRNQIGRKRLAACKLRLQLGGFPIFPSQCLENPKWTRRRTYKRIRNEIRRHGVLRRR
jgi:hypothetical protein